MNKNDLDRHLTTSPENRDYNRQCCRHIYGGDSFHGRRCSRMVTYKHSDGKFYCAQHHPERIVQREAAKVRCARCGYGQVVLKGELCPRCAKAVRNAGNAEELAYLRKRVSELEARLRLAQTGLED